jgi:hypothetical protein
MENPKKNSVFVHKDFEKWSSRILEKRLLRYLPQTLENNATIKYFYTMGINYFYGHFEGGNKGFLCHGIKEGIIN